MCRIRVKDETGKDRYELGCFPQQASETDPRITSWQIRLADLHHKIYTNVLAAAVDPTQDTTQIGWLDPGKFAKLVRIQAYHTGRMAKLQRSPISRRPHMMYMVIE